MKFFLFSLFLLALSLNSVVPLDTIVSGQVSKEQLYELSLNHEKYEKELLIRFITSLINSTQTLDKQDPRVLLALMVAYERVVLFEISSDDSTQAFNKLDEILKSLNAVKAQNAVYKMEEFAFNQDSHQLFKGNLKKLFKLSLVSERNFFSTYKKAHNILSKNHNYSACEEILGAFDKNEQNLYLIALQGLLQDFIPNQMQPEVYQELPLARMEQVIEEAPELEPSGCLFHCQNFSETLLNFFNTFIVPGIGNENFYPIN